MQTQFVKRVCDYCSGTIQIPVGGFDEKLQSELESWITLAREYIVQGQPFPVVKHACRESCAKNLLATNALTLPEHVQAAKDGTNVKPFPAPAGGQA